MTSPGPSHPREERESFGIHSPQVEAPWVDTLEVCSSRVLLERGLALILLVGSWSACMSACSGGCTGPSGEAYVYPENDPAHPEAIVEEGIGRAQITQSFLDAIRPVLPLLIRSAISGGTDGLTIDTNDVLHFRIPDTDLFDIGVAEAKLRNGEAYLWLGELDQKLSLTFEEPNSLVLRLDALRLGLALDLKEEVIGVDSSCGVVSSLGPSGPGPLRHAAVIDAGARVRVSVGARPDRRVDVEATASEVSIEELAVEVVDSSQYCLEPECTDCGLEVFGECLDLGGRCAECYVFCGAITRAAAALASALFEAIAPSVQSLMTDALESAVDGALAGIDGKPAKVETAISVRDISGLDASNVARTMGVLIGVEPGDLPVVDRGEGPGMEITLEGGATGDQSPCVPTPPAFDATHGPTPILTGVDRLGRPYHFAFTVAASMLDHLLWAAHRSGQLCLHLTSEEIRNLSGGSFTLDASLLSLLSSNLATLAKEHAPVIVTLHPRHPGKISFGSEEVVGHNDAGKEIRDWLIKLSVADLGVALHVLVHDRYVRIVEVSADVFVGLSVEADDDERLHLSLGELRVDDLEETFNELLPSTNFAEVLPAILELALGAILREDPSIDLDFSGALSAALGGVPIGVQVRDIVRDGRENDYLTVTMTMTSSPAPSGTGLRAVQTFASVDSIEGGIVEPTPDASRRQGRATGRVHLVVGDREGETDRRDDSRLEYQVRIDRGVWRHPVRPNSDGTIVVELPVLKLPGLHHVEVRARRIDDPRALDDRPVVLPIFVDVEAPSLSVRTDGALLRIEVEDEDARGVELFAIADGRKIDVPVERADDHPLVTTRNRTVWRATLPMIELPALSNVALVGRDVTGNTSAPLQIPLTDSLSDSITDEKRDRSEDAPETEGASGSMGSKRSRGVREELLGCRCIREGDLGRPGLATPWLFALLAIVCVSAPRFRPRRRKGCARVCTDG